MYTIVSMVFKYCNVKLFEPLVYLNVSVGGGFDETFVIPVLSVLGRFLFGQ